MVQYSCRSKVQMIISVGLDCTSGSYEDMMRLMSKDNMAFMTLGVRL